MTKVLICSIFISLLASHSIAQTVFVDAKLGNDSNLGAKESPVRTLRKASEIVNSSRGHISTEVILVKGIYVIDSAIIFKPETKYSRTNRLTIRSEILPNESGWTPADMPVILPTLFDQRTDGDGTWSNGLQIEVSHAIVQGLKIMGSPVHEYLEKDQIIRSYPLVRDGAKLTDLLVKQCVFVGNDQILPLHLAIYASGDEVVVDQCIFYNCKVGVLYVNYSDKETIGNALTNSLFVGSYGAAVWIMNTSEDFSFNGNAIVNSNYAMILQAGSEKKYKIENSLFANNLEVLGTGDGALLNFSTLPLLSIELGESVKITGRKILINLDQGDRDYLHIVDEDPAIGHKAGLFGN